MLFEESISSDTGFHSVLCDSWLDFQVTTLNIQIKKISIHSKNVNFHKNYMCHIIFFQSGLCDKHPSNLMGEPATKKEEGVFFLSTNSHPPYAIPPRRYSRNMET